LVFLVPALMALDPGVVVIHPIRDGRDVVSSLLDLGWLSARVHVEGGTEHGSLDVGLRGDTPRYWTERSRLREFTAVSEAYRGAWTWRRHVLAGLRDVTDPERTVTVRYESMCSDPAGEVTRLADVIGVPKEETSSSLAALTPESIGRWRHDLSQVQLADVYREAGELLRFLDFDDLPAAFDPELADVLGAPDRARTGPH
jgi:hypothetical protein